MFWSIDNDDFRGNCHSRAYPLIEAGKEVLLGYFTHIKIINSEYLKIMSSILGILNWNQIREKKLKFPQNLEINQNQSQELLRLHREKILHNQQQHQNHLLHLILELVNIKLNIINFTIIRCRY